MKLDRIKFAKLVGWLSYRFNIEIHEYDDLDMLDQLCDIDVAPVEVPGKANPATVNELMRAIHVGEKIAAIKAYREMTGFGLKEVKDAVEKDWKDKKAELRDAMNKSINNQLSGISLANKDYVLEKFNIDQLNLVKDFINSFY